MEPSIYCLINTPEQKYLMPMFSPYQANPNSSNVVDYFDGNSQFLNFLGVDYLQNWQHQTVQSTQTVQFMIFCPDANAYNTYSQELLATNVQKLNLYRQNENNISGNSQRQPKLETHQGQSNSAFEGILAIRKPNTPPKHWKTFYQLKTIVENLLEFSKKNQRGYLKAYGKACFTNIHLKHAFQVFEQKVRSFRKSKQEMLKIIIRRIQKHHRVTVCRKRDKRFLLFGGFRSMNISYLKKLFSDPLFVESYKFIAQNFMNKYQQQNEIRIIQFLEIISVTETEEDALQVIALLNEKGRMPWPRIWMQKIERVLVELYDRFVETQPETQQKNQAKNSYDRST